MSLPDIYVIRVPSSGLSGGGADMRSRLQTWEWRSTLPDWAHELVIDFTGNRFIEPWSLSQYTAYVLKIGRELGIPIRAELSGSNPSNVYIDSMGINYVLKNCESTQDWDESRQNTGLHVIKTHQDVTRFVHSVGQLGPGPGDETMDALRYGMAELGRNVVQHSNSAIGGVAIAQFFPDRGAIQISISDCGCGILSSLMTTYPELKNDLEGLKLALLPHVSGAFRHGMYSASENAGLGLFFTKEICWRSGGSFWIASNRALIGVTDNEASGNQRIYRQINNWQGTSVTMDLPATGVVDFGGLLEVCRSLATEAQKCSGPSGLDFLVEIPELDGLQIISVGDFNEDVEVAANVRKNKLLPAVMNGELVVLDFAGSRFATQSFIHALLNDVFRVPASLCRLSFVNCTRSTEEAIRAVAAYSASYRQCV
ncbi:MAG: hypothetical protein JXA81_12265 [Sedimentisphaerales bacterium]|nr:hypothetical protein [Sedimentisphaerales bacterium]